MAFFGAQATLGDQAAKAGPALAGFGQGREIGPVGEAQTGSRDQARGVEDMGRGRLRDMIGAWWAVHVGGLPLADLAGDIARRLMGADDARHGIVIGNRHGGQADEGGTLHVFFGVRRPGEEGEIRGGRQFGKHGES